MDYENLSPELREKAKACTTSEELMAFAASEGIELTLEQLDGLSGGLEWGCKNKDCNDNFCSDFSVLD